MRIASDSHVSDAVLEFLKYADDGFLVDLLLSIGSDPTPQIEAIAKAKAQEYRSLALGQGQDEADQGPLLC